jgi:hypothetical protein
MNNVPVPASFAKIMIYDPREDECVCGDPHTSLSIFNGLAIPARLLWSLTHAGKAPPSLLLNMLQRTASGPAALQ